MKKILFITDTETPYRNSFFDILAKHVDLTVLCECKYSSSRDKSWISGKYNHNVVFLGEERHEKRLLVTIRMMNYVLKNHKSFDEIIFGCINTRPQIITYLLLRLLNINFSFNFDGETIFDDKGLKLLIKKMLLSGAKKYYVAGEESTRTLKDFLNNNAMYIPYYFSSLKKNEIYQNAKKEAIRNKDILVIGRFFPYKGVDVALEAAKLMPEEHFKIIGAGDKSIEIENICIKNNLSNVEIIPFLDKSGLEKEYLQCKCLLLPTRRECWGLVVNEAASYGTPIISTYGSGAAVEFLKKDYSCFLATPGSASSLVETIQIFNGYSSEEIQKYTSYLKSKSLQYSIEQNVDRFIVGINSVSD